jgi:Glycosyl transferase family 2
MSVNVRRALESGPFRPVAAIGYNAVVGAELAVERAADHLDRSTGQQRSVNDLTVLIRTFERPRALRRLVASIRRFYPEVRVVVADDSRNPQPLDGVETITLPYDCGVSFGRNELVARAETPFILLLDDDYVFYRHTQLGPALAAMEQNPEIDIMGGQLVNLPFYRKLPLSLRGPLYPTSARPVLEVGSTLGGFEVAAKVPVFFLGRRERVALVPWDPKATRSGHADFFTSALGVLVTVYNPRLRCLHVKTPFDAEYMAMRLDYDAEAEHLAAKYGID